MPISTPEAATILSQGGRAVSAAETLLAAVKPAVRCAIE